MTLSLQLKSEACNITKGERKPENTRLWQLALYAEKLEAENALEKKRNRELEAENLSFARECNLVADEKKELKEENQRLLAMTVGWTMAHCCISLDNGIDPRSMEMPAVLEEAERALLGGGDGQNVTTS